MRRLASILLTLLSVLAYSQDVSENVTAIEYFFDLDPGVGNGQSITVSTPDQTVTETATINTSSLSGGFHRVYFRMQASNGVWGMPYGYLLFVDSVSSSVSQISSLEYYWDLDPGYGMGSPIPITTVATEIEETDAITTASIATGFHRLFVRAQDDSGNWGIAESRLVYVDSSLGALKDTIDQVEYYWDMDPGYGNGALITVSNPDTLLTVDDLLPTDTLANGFHNLFVRARSKSGIWGIAESRLVYVDSSLGASKDTIDQIEYFWDIDPGYGNGALISVAVPDTTLDISDMLATDTLANGFHTLFVRARSNSGTWGMPESRLVYVDNAIGALQDTIVSAEYYWDNDPGYGNGGTLNVSDPLPEIQLNGTIATDTLSTGFHKLFVRALSASGRWGMAESRLVYVDISGGLTVTEIDAIEYFWDADPGYGNATALTIMTPMDSLQLMDSVDTEGQATGFHHFFLRARDSNGTWGMAESRLVYIDVAGTLVQDIEELEYFIDTDPGYGLANSIPITTPEYDVFREFAIATASVSQGEHVLGVRAKTEEGTWSIAEIMPFISYSEGRELDSVSLRLMYKELAGTGWTSSNNWMNTTIDQWFGVSVVSDRVDSLILPSNNVMGQLPYQLSYLTELKKLDLSYNMLEDTVPSELIDLTGLQELYLNNNALSQFSDLSSIAGLQTVALDTNYFDFGDLEYLVGIDNYSYSGQLLPEISGIDSVVRVGANMALTESIGGINNTYQWYLNGEPITSQDLTSLSINSFTASDTGYYQLLIQNTLVENLELAASTYYLYLNDFDQDSLALVSLYNNTIGGNWINNDGWLSGSLNSWLGVTLHNGRVTEINLPENNLAGIIPQDLIYADSLLDLDLSSNSIADTLPSSLTTLSFISSINVAENDLTSIPSFSSTATLQTLNVSANKLQFGDLENNLGIGTFSYASQDSISSYRDTLIDRDANISFGFDVSGANNLYQWYKDDEVIANASGDDLSITAAQFANEGVYRLEISNSLLPDLTLTSGVLELKITSLLRDSSALRAIYTKMNGDNWSPDLNWLDEPITAWDSIEIANERVIALTLQSANLTGTLPREIRDITSLETIDLSDNNIAVIPNMTQMPELTTFDMKGNRLGFAEIILNQQITGFDYDPQQLLGESTSDTIAQGTSYQLAVAVSGANNEYEWLFDGNFITTGQSDTYSIDSMVYDSMGVYTVSVSNPALPGLLINSEDFNVQAIADLTFVALGQGGTPISQGTGYALRVRETGNPYDTIKVVNGPGSGIVFDGLLLADYIIAVKTEEELYLPTYHPNTDLWTEAQQLEFRNDYLETMNMVLDPDELPPLPEGGVVQGTVEAELQDEANGRVNARRKVKRAGCSVRRFVPRGRTDQQEGDFVLYAYVESDDEGRFEFTDLEDGRYRFNIEYPGIPMDNKSFVEFTIGEGGIEDEVLILEALVTETGIFVEQIKRLGFYRKYFKDLNVYPNPANQSLRIAYGKLMSASVEVRLLDLQGNVLREQTIEKGTNKELNLDVATIREGVYMLNFVDINNEVETISTFKVYIKH